MHSHARLSMNAMPLVVWKGQTFNQVVCAMKHNKPEPPNHQNIFSALPSKIYRKELAPSNSRIVSIDTMLQPGGSIMTDLEDVGVCTTLDMCIPNNSTEMDKHIMYKDGKPCYMPVHDALNRVRSARNRAPGYNSSASQYLVNRGITFKQQQITHAHNNESGGTYFTPGGATCLNNKSCANTTYKPSNAKFATQGGVSAGARLDRLKYDTIRTVASRATGNLGKDSYRASLSQQGMTMKDKLGYPNAGCNLSTCF